MKGCSINDVLAELYNVNKAVTSLFKKTNENKGASNGLDFLVEYEDSADGRLFQSELPNILERLYELQQDIIYLQMPIVENGFLKLNTSGRFEMITSDGRVIKEFYSGSLIEALVYDQNNECETWIISRVESTGEKYYIFGYKTIVMDGLPVRIRK